MAPSEPRRDLVVLVADKDMDLALRGMLARPESLATRPISHTILRHEDHDAGVRLGAHEHLRGAAADFRYALALFDHHGCGADARPATDVETSVQERLDGAGWRGRSAVVVFEPELEAWVWSASPRVHETLGISAQQRRDVLEHYGSTDLGKPGEPKAAMHAALRLSGRPPSAALFGELASAVGLRRCRDRSFQRLVGQLRKWFPPAA
ncbi:hypothetical protein CMK11_15510 [Candidatus Poribacteria bacterium]|nr:hypothetical protein [Candidatus Poribacteria bacterium]